MPEIEQIHCICMPFRCEQITIDVVFDTIKQCKDFQVNPYDLKILVTHEIEESLLRTPRKY